MAESKATAKWTGTLKEGSGSMSGASGHFSAPFTFKSRFEGESTGTNPEELIGAAHAGCFSMFLAAQLTTAGHPPSSIETEATVPIVRPRGKAPPLPEVMIVSPSTSFVLSAR